MAKGLKRICMNCGARFYDLDKTPIICPSCETEFTGEIKAKTRRGRTPVEEVVPAKVVAVKAVEDEDADDEIDDIDADDDIVSLDDVDDDVDDEDEDTTLTIDDDPDDLDDLDDDIDDDEDDEDE